MSNNPTLDSLFPTPSLPPSPISPARWAGVTPQTVQVLKNLLKDNYEKWHIFWNDRGYHKCVFSHPFFSRLRSDKQVPFSSHAAHRSLALWAVGADDALIEAAYETDTSYLRKTYPSPNGITPENFKDHLGDPKYVNNDHPFKNSLCRLLTVCLVCVDTGAPIWSTFRAKL